MCSEQDLQSFQANVEPIMITWTETWQGLRAEGIFIGMSDPGLEHGREANVSPSIGELARLGGERASGHRQPEPLSPTLSADGGSQG